MNSTTQDNRQTVLSSNRFDKTSLPEAQKQCRRLAKSHYENFLVASILLPKRLRQPFYDVYAFCRTADDLADESPSPTIATQRLAEFQNRLNAMYSGESAEELFLALANTAHKFRLAKKPFDDLLDAFRQDQVKTEYEDFEQLEHYCRRSANPVGRIVLQLADASSDRNNQLSDSICTGLQLANFWQDVERDRSIGRTYLPKDQMNRFAVTAEMLELRSTSQELKALLASECERAEQFLRDGLALSDHVPNWLAKDVKLFAHGGLATLSAIRKIDFDVLRKRPTVSKWTQFGLVAKAMMGQL